MGMIHSDPPCTCGRNQQGDGPATCNTPTACRLLDGLLERDASPGEGSGVLLWPLGVLVVICAIVGAMVLR